MLISQPAGTAGGTGNVSICGQKEDGWNGKRGNCISTAGGFVLNCDCKLHMRTSGKCGSGSFMCCSHHAPDGTVA